MSLREDEGRFLIRFNFLFFVIMVRILLPFWTLESDSNFGFGRNSPDKDLRTLGAEGR